MAALRRPAAGPLLGALQGLLGGSRGASQCFRHSSSIAYDTMGGTSPKVLRPGGWVNARVEEMEYAVRGPLVTRAGELAAQLEDQGAAGAARLGFDRVIYCNIGNPQACGQRPVTFARQVLACCVWEGLAELGAGALPRDVVERARRLLQISSGGLGAYSESRGLRGVRLGVVEALKKRDGWPAEADHVFLTNGASDGVKSILSMVVRDASDAVLVPIPQYPLYSATMTLVGGVRLPYELDEARDWSLSTEELKHKVDQARKQGVTVRALVVINPGNPTGQVLSMENMQDIVRFCERERLVILADEVYQTNVYGTGHPFTSFKKVVRDMNSSVELVSFHSVSKGMLGECGMRGGFMEIVNFDPQVVDLVYKYLSVSLCPNLPGQILVDVMMNPPQPGDESYPLYKAEMEGIFQSLKRKALKLAEALNSFEGITCNESEGAMYLFPQLRLPRGAHDEAKRRNLDCPDQLYVAELLEETGICVVPGSGFGQALGTLHFRTTFLPPEEEIDSVIDKLRKFHENFLERYSAK